MDEDYERMAKQQAYDEQMAYAKSTAGMCGSALYPAPQPMTEDELKDRLAKQAAQRDLYERRTIAQHALGSAVQYAVGRSRSAEEVTRDAQVFMDFLAQTPAPVPTGPSE